MCMAGVTEMPDVSRSVREDGPRVTGWPKTAHTRCAGNGM